MIVTLLLAAGASRRMRGMDKLLQPVEGIPLLQLVASRALSVAPLFVTLPSARHKRRFVLPPAARIVPVAGQMSDSLKAGIAALPAQVTHVMILPADMPDITAQDIATLHERARTSGKKIVRGATEQGVAGHPVCFAASLFPHFAELTGDLGARAMLRDYADDTLLVRLAGERARLDLDTPEDWAAYRARS